MFLRFVLMPEAVTHVTEFDDGNESGLLEIDRLAHSEDDANIGHQED